MDLGLSRQTLTSKADNEARKLPQYIAALSATVGGFVMGTALGWSSPATPLLQKGGEYSFNVTSNLIGGLMPAGAILGAAVAGTSADLAGRRTSLLAMVLPGLLGWALIMWASAAALMYVGRALLGLVTGFLSVVAPLYTNEISQVSIRGTLGTYFQLQCTLGILFTYVVGTYVDVFLLSLGCGVFVVIYFILMFFMPESPKFYLKKARKEDAAKSLQWLRGSQYDISEELQELQDSVTKAEAEKVSLTEAFKDRAAKMGLFVGLGVMFFQQFCGINAVIFYTVAIFKDAKSTLNPNTCTIIVGSISVVSTYVSTLVVDKLGRKPMLLFSDVMMALSSGLLGFYFYAKSAGHDVESISWLPLACVSVFIVVFSLGFGPIPWMFMSEIFPSRVMGPACSVACLFNWVCVVVITMGFDPVVDAIGQGVTFWGFTGFSVLGSLFVFFFVPETKGKTLDEVTAVLGGARSKTLP